MEEMGEEETNQTHFVTGIGYIRFRLARSSVVFALFCTNQTTFEGCV